MQFDFSLDNVICDGNILIAQFNVTRNDGGVFTNEKLPNILWGDDLIFPDIHDVNNPEDGSHVGWGGGDGVLSGDKRSYTFSRIYTDLPRTVRTGDELLIRFSSINQLKLKKGKSVSIETLDNGKQIIKFTVPEIEEPVPLEFKNPYGEVIFTAKLTNLSIKAVSDKLDFEHVSLDSSKMPDNIDSLDAQAVADWYADYGNSGWYSMRSPKFLDENMEYTENVYNGNVYYTNSFGYTEAKRPEGGTVLGKNDSVCIFGSAPELEKVKYIEWFGCTAEIPDMSE